MTHSTSTPSASKPTSPARIVIADDHPIVRAGLASLINAEPDLSVCGQAEDAREALALVERERPDLVLVDLSLGETSGLELLRALAEKPVALLVVSMHNDPVWAERALAAGAQGYVLKSEATAKVVTAIRSVLAGRAFVSEPVSQRLIEKMIRPGAGDGQTPLIDSLSDRELEVFERIGKGLSTRQIAEALALSPKTVQTYRERIKEKLGLESAAELSTWATRFVVDDPS